ncbi:TonB-linked outer membrane protein, SusC/RagA family [Algibacter lectus]|uniref:SusC/RagA family TonB-linked outer membrane protein n=1 Tax=Algibacter lectus TaxID=221126 RepID=UPI0008E8D628|nr:TonB-dependent receptor [Algibacter lectus]SFD32111.1 TonB-linked outer membrane protein, SusC/RagA family [Algibacter lectus]
MKFKNYLSKLIILFIIISLIPITSYGNNSKNILELKISIKLENAKLTTIFSKLKKENDINFSFGERVIEDNSKYTINYNDIELVNILNDLGLKGGFKYQIIENNILIKKNEFQERVRGKISDVNGVPLPGASIVEKGTSHGTTSNFEGEFSIVVSEPRSLFIVSFIGYKTKEVTLNRAENNEVVLLEDVNELDHVLIVGYGKQKRRDITGAISSVSDTDISEVPSTNAIQALKGKVAGVDIYNGGNEPGSDVTIRIRGQRSIGADNSPLVVLDGIPIIGGLNEINPNDISSIEVLKDASATAIYGSRASNGVILVTTKRGVTGKTSVNFSSYYGQTSVINHLDLMNGEEFASLRREAERTVSGNGTYPDDSTIFDNIALESLKEGRETDWQKLIYGNGSKENHQLGIMGGSESTQFSTSLNYFKEQGIVENSKFERASIRVNLDHQISDKIKFGVSSFISRTKQNITQNDLFDNVLRLNPLGWAYGEDNEVLFRPTNDESQRVNPLSDIDNSLSDNFKTRVFASLFAEYKLLDNLSYRLNIGPDLQFNKTGYFYGSNTTNNQGGASTAGTSNADVTSLVIENILNYNPDLGDKHSISTTLVQSYQNQIQKTNYTNVKNLPYDSQTYNNLGSAGEVTSIGSNHQKWRLLSYTARFNYQFDQRYLFTLTGRADGSSRFSEGNKWGFFPSAAIGWRLSKEDFFNVPNEIISDLKFRVSYGETGNTAIEPYQTFSTLNKSYYAFGNNAAPGFSPGSISNPELKWETTKQTNFGLDFEVWNRNLTGSLNYYKADTQDLLLPRSLPTSSGFTTVLENIGSTRNTGVEVNLSLNNILSSKDFRWEADFTFSTNKNKITQIYGDGKDDIGNLWFIGQPINVFYDYRKVGIWQLDEADEAASFGFEPGQIKVEDINGDKAIDANDRVVLGSPTPKWIAGMTQRFSYKGFLLSVVMQTRQNNLISSEFYGNNNRLAGRYNNLDVDYWTPENPTNENPRPNVSQESVYLGSTLTYKDVSFVRVRNLMLSYSIPEEVLKQINLTGLTFNFTAENPFTITNYEGFDPEFESNGERALYPSTKTIALGVNINF